jgi:hypothetical protein
MSDRLRRVFIAGFAFSLLVAVAGADVPTMISYQGIMLDSQGDPITEPVNVTFTIYDLPSGGTTIWQEIQLVEFDGEGHFDVTLGEVNPITVDVFDDPVRWLGVQIEGDDELEPRTRIVSVAYAQRAGTADGAGGGGWVDDGDVVRLETSTDNVGIGTSTPLSKLHVVGDGNYALAGSVAPTGSDEYIGTIGIVEGGSGTNTGVLGSASDGGVNRGVSGEANGLGNDNIGVLGNATDGTFNRGLVGEAHGPGDENIGVYGYAEGGDENWAGFFNGNVGVAQDVEVQGKATIGPGHTNTGPNAFVAGGSNTASGDYATVSGGFNNIASIEFTALGGGVNNTASGSSATLGGGVGNAASGIAATVSGGGYNIASGYFSAIPGGGSNEAVGEYSYAAGRRAKANHNGTFVWGDDTELDFTSTANNQFLIRASGGVGIGTNSPSAALHVNGEAKCEVGGVEFFMVPRGAIIMWSGLLADIPSGWALCDGTNGTPDLRERFVYCVQSGEDPGELGGSATIPAHNHNVDIAEFISLQSEESITVQEGFGFTFPLHGANHDIDPPSTLSSDDGSASNIPPYYKLAFIMKL